jgi:uncharacterized protein YbaR (Trm112 family)
LKKNSINQAIRILQSIGLNSVAWSLRRLNCPVSSKALVLEVGSGGNPYYRSNILLDAYEVTRERHWAPLITDRPTVIGFVENLPFRDDAFDYVIASHVLEHSSDPSQFLSELQRVAKAGYIEVPDAFMERINPYKDHRLEITVRNERLLIRIKGAWQVDPDLVELYEDRVKGFLTKETMREHPFDFHVRYYWEGKIDYKIVNPEIFADWSAPESSSYLQAKSVSFRSKISQVILQAARRFFSQNRRNNEINLTDFLACPACKRSSFAMLLEEITCRECGEIYPIRNGIPVMYPPTHDRTTSTQL